MVAPGVPARTPIAAPGASCTPMPVAGAHVEVRRRGRARPRPASARSGVRATETNRSPRRRITWSASSPRAPRTAQLRTTPGAAGHQRRPGRRVWTTVQACGRAARRPPVAVDRADAARRELAAERRAHRAGARDGSSPSRAAERRPARRRSRDSGDERRQRLSGRRARARAPAAAARGRRLPRASRTSCAGVGRRDRRAAPAALIAEAVPRAAPRSRPGPPARWARPPPGRSPRAARGRRRRGARSAPSPRRARCPPDARRRAPPPRLRAGRAPRSGSSSPASRSRARLGPAHELHGHEPAVLPGAGREHADHARVLGPLERPSRSTGRPRSSLSATRRPRLTWIASYTTARVPRPSSRSRRKPASRPTLSRRTRTHAGRRRRSGRGCARCRSPAYSIATPSCSGPAGCGVGPEGDDPALARPEVGRACRCAPVRRPSMNWSSANRSPSETSTSSTGRPLVNRSAAPPHHPAGLQVGGRRARSPGAGAAAGRRARTPRAAAARSRSPDPAACRWSGRGSSASCPAPSTSGRSAGGRAREDHEPDDVAALDREVGVEQVHPVVARELVPGAGDLERVVAARAHHRRARTPRGPSAPTSAGSPRPRARPACARAGPTARSCSPGEPAAGGGPGSRALPGSARSLPSTARPRRSGGAHGRRLVVVVADRRRRAPTATPRPRGRPDQPRRTPPAGAALRGRRRASGSGSTVCSSSAAAPGGGGGPRPPRRRPRASRPISSTSAAALVGPLGGILRRAPARRPRRARAGSSGRRALARGGGSLVCANSTAASLLRGDTPRFR